MSPLPDGKTWVIRRDFGYEVGYEGSDEAIDVPIGFQTDFASVPRPLWWLMPRWGRYGNAAVIHDFCYWDQRYTRRRADQIFLEAMIVLGVQWWKRTLMYSAVRGFGWGAWRGNKKRRQKEQDRVLPVPEKAVEQRQW